MQINETTSTGSVVIQFQFNQCKDKANSTDPTISMLNLGTKTLKGIGCDKDEIPYILKTAFSALTADDYSYFRIEEDFKNSAKWVDNANYNNF